MTEPTALRLRRLALPRSPRAPGPGVRWAGVLLLRLGCAALLAWIGYIHLHLWLEGYRHIRTDGPLFLLGAVAGFVLASVLLAWPRPLAGLLAAGYTISTLGALLISLTAGLFGFRESISARTWPAGRSQPSCASCWAGCRASAPPRSLTGSGPVHQRHQASPL
jgi:hypothetical protein